MIKRSNRKSIRRKRMNLTIPEDVIKEAKELNINTSQAAEDGITAAIRKEKEAAWLAENHAAIKAHNEWIHKHGLLLPQPRWVTEDGAL